MWSLRALCLKVFFVFCFWAGWRANAVLKLALITEIIGTLRITGSVERRSKYVKIIRFCPLNILRNMSNRNKTEWTLRAERDIRVATPS